MRYHIQVGLEQIHVEACWINTYTEDDTPTVVLPGATLTFEVDIIVKEIGMGGQGRTIYDSEADSLCGSDPREEALTAAERNRGLR